MPIRTFQPENGNTAPILMSSLIFCLASASSPHFHHHLSQKCDNDIFHSQEYNLLQSILSDTDWRIMVAGHPTSEYGWIIAVHLAELQLIWLTWPCPPNTPSQASLLGTSLATMQLHVSFPTPEVEVAHFHWSVGRSSSHKMEVARSHWSVGLAWYSSGHQLSIISSPHAGEGSLPWCSSAHQLLISRKVWIGWPNGCLLRELPYTGWNVY